MADESPRKLFAVITDSTADIDLEMARDRGITVVPLTVTIGDESYSDGVLTQQEFFDRMNSAPSLPTTSQPAIGAFADAYARALETCENVISVHISERLSGTIESARAAAEQFSGRVHVFDSRNLSWGLTWQVLDAAAAAREGLGPDAALIRLARLRDEVRLIVGLDSLDNLAKGGRIGRVGAFLGGMLNFKVTLTVDSNGEFQPVGRSRGDKAAFTHTLDWIAEKMDGATRGRFAVGHALGLERAEAFAAALRERYDVSELVIYETGSVISAHTGTGWGIAVVPEP